MKPAMIYALTVVFGLLIAFIIYFTYIEITEPYPFQIEKEGIVFKSKTDSPGILLQDAKKSVYFIVSPAIIEDSQESQHLVVASNNVIVVLEANQKNVTQVVRSVDSSNNLLECATNDGNVLNSRVISVSECETLLEDRIGKVIYIEQPNPNLSQPEVIVEPSAITIKPSNIADSSRVALETVKAMYPESEAIIAYINQILSTL